MNGTISSAIPFILSSGSFLLFSFSFPSDSLSRMPTITRSALPCCRPHRRSRYRRQRRHLSHHDDDGVARSWCLCGREFNLHNFEYDSVFVVKSSLKLELRVKTRKGKKKTQTSPPSRVNQQQTNAKIFTWHFLMKFINARTCASHSFWLLIANAFVFETCVFSPLWHWNSTFTSRPTNTLGSRVSHSAINFAHSFGLHVPLRYLPWRCITWEVRLQTTLMKSFDAD